MLRTDRRLRSLAVLLSALAGYVDAIGFIKLGGFFVSFMSGNTTRAAVGIAEGSGSGPLAFGLVFNFVLGVILGAIIGKAGSVRRQSAVLGLVAALLALAGVFDLLGLDSAAIVAMTLAMGAVNNVFERDGEVASASPT